MIRRIQVFQRMNRKAEELYNAVSHEYSLDADKPNSKKIEAWVTDLIDDAKYNFGSYAECFISENLVRRYIQENKIPLSKEANEEVVKWLKKELDNKNKGNLSIELRKINSKLSYLSMDGLANLVDKRDPIREACLSRDANEYKPIRDALAHTALLTDDAKIRLSTVYTNIKERIRGLLTGKNTIKESKK